ncbi:hypothetical protein EES41_37175 (plasmid) [Streptomyces sp. ADI95-16]|nr:hypothetical protein EES41_37175 [Streptomyces sp. ADI95-16]
MFGGLAAGDPERPGELGPTRALAAGRLDQPLSCSRTSWSISSAARACCGPAALVVGALMEGRYAFSTAWRMVSSAATASTARTGGAAGALYDGLSAEWVPLGTTRSKAQILLLGAQDGSRHTTVSASFASICARGEVKSSAPRFAEPGRERWR